MHRSGGSGRAGDSGLWRGSWQGGGCGFLCVICLSSQTRKQCHWLVTLSLLKCKIGQHGCGPILGPHNSFTTCLESANIASKLNSAHAAPGPWHGVVWDGGALLLAAGEGCEGVARSFLQCFLPGTVGCFLGPSLGCCSEPSLFPALAVP